MKNVNIIRSIVMSLFIIGQSLICDSEMVSISASNVMIHVCHDLMIGTINAENAIQRISKRYHDIAQLEQYLENTRTKKGRMQEIIDNIQNFIAGASSFFTSIRQYSPEEKDIAQRILTMLIHQKEMCASEYKKAYIASADKKALQARYEDFQQKLKDLEDEQKIIIGHMSSAKKILLGTAVLGTAMFLRHYFASNAGKKEMQELRQVGQKMIKVKADERRLDKAVLELEKAYNEHKQMHEQLAPEEREKLQKRGKSEIINSMTWAFFGAFMNSMIPLIEGPLLIPLQPFLYGPHPVFGTLGVSMFLGVKGIYDIVRSRPESTPVPTILGDIFPH